MNEIIAEINSEKGSSPEKFSAARNGVGNCGIKKMALADCEWEVLDRIMISVITCAHLLPKSNFNNGSTITVKLAPFSDTCGYTKLVAANLFHRVNAQRRRDLSLHHGIIFENSGHGYEKAKFTFTYNPLPPVLHKMFAKRDYQCAALVAPQHDGGLEDPVEQQLPVPPLVAVAAAPLSPTIVDLNKRRYTTVTHTNNKQTYWVKIPAASGVIHNEQHFRSVCNKVDLNKMLQLIAGSPAQGVYLLTKRLYRTNKAESLRAMESLGLKPFQTLSAAATVAAKAYANISGRALIKLNSFLRHHNHMKSVFSPRSRSKLIKPLHTVPPVHGQYKYKESLGHGLFKWVNVRFLLAKATDIANVRKAKILEAQHVANAFKALYNIPNTVPLFV